MESKHHSRLSLRKRTYNFLSAFLFALLIPLLLLEVQPKPDVTVGRKELPATGESGGKRNTLYIFENMVFLVSFCCLFVILVS